MTSGVVSPWGLLDGREHEWRQQIRGVSLVAEADIEPEESRPVLAAFGQVYGKYKGSAVTDKLRAFRKWPACVVVGMTGAAAAHYEEGTYWRKLWDAVRYPGSPQDQRVWGKSFLGALATLGLPDFPGSHQPYLGPILMHCGIPTYCLKDLLRALIEHSRRDPGLDADAFMSWATSGPHRMNSLDKPVQHLLLDGGEYAYDILDRLLELLDRLHEPKPDLFGVGLPRRLVDEACSLGQRQLLGLTPASRRNSRRRITSKPCLALDPFGEGPLVRLPPIRGTWRINVDGHTHDIRASASWAADESAETPFPLARPARHVQVVSLGDTVPLTIAVVNDDDPLLLFSEDGTFLPPSRPLPPDVVWALFPDDRELITIGEAHVVSEAPVPFGWYGWTLQELDLRETKELGLTSGRTREVRGAGHPHLLLPEPLPGITGTHRQPVYDSPPLISLPSADSARTWYIELREVNAEADSTPIRLKEYSGDVDPWRGLARPIIGTFDVTILGPLGFRLRRRVAVAEGLSVRYEPTVRLLTANGLDPAEARFVGRATISSTRLRFDEHRLDRTITYGATAFSATPPYMSVLHDNEAGGARWSAKPLHLTTEALTEAHPGVLLVRAPSTLKLPPLKVTSNSATQDVWSSGVHRDGQARYELLQVRDTASRVRQLELGLSIGNRLVPLAAVRPRVLASGAELTGGQLRLTGCRAIPGLYVGIYMVYAPWRGVSVLPVGQNGIASLPVRLRTSGPLRILPAMRDASSSWPYWPATDPSFLVQVPERPSIGDAAELALSDFLAGAGPCPEEIEYERLWLIVTLAECLQADGAREDLRQQCEMQLRSDPVAALLALSRTRLNPAEALTQLIRAGLSGLKLTGRFETADTRHLWTRLPVVAILLAGETLADPGRMPELADMVGAEHGDVAAQMLCGEADPFPGPDAENSRSAAPAALIDTARLAAEISRAVSHTLPQNATQAVSDAVELLTRTQYGALAARIDARPDGPPRLSAALALASRAAAGQADLQRGFQRKYRVLWSEIAQSMPDLVSIDIIAAQAAVSAVDRKYHTGGPRD